MRIDDRVAAEIAVYAAKAAHRLAVLEALEKETPALSGTSNRRLHLARKLKGARSLAQSWARVAELITEERDAEDDAAFDKEFPPAPERTVAWSGYVADQENVLVCNHKLGCKISHPDVRSWTGLTSADLPDGGICARCGTDVLA